MAHDTSTPVKIIKAASACVWRGDEVLLVQRGKSLGYGLWSLPGGRIEEGETAIEAAARELLEETGVLADLQHHVGDFTVESPQSRFVISCHAGQYVSGTGLARSDAMALAWVSIANFAAYPLAIHTEVAARRARQLLSL